MFVLLSLLLLPVIAFVCCLIPFRQQILKNWVYILLLVIITLLFLVRFFDGHSTIIQKDANLLQLPFSICFQDSILNFSHVPLWNPYLWSGIANLAHPLSHVVHSTAFLAVLLPIHQAFTLSISLAIFFSAAFMFLLLIELEQNSGVALIAAVAYAFNEFTLDRLGAPSGPGVEYLQSYSIVPLSLVLLLRAF